MQEIIDKLKQDNGRHKYTIEPLLTGKSIASIVNQDTATISYAENSGWKQVGSIYTSKPWKIVQEALPTVMLCAK
mgnify:CR=1 FL=1